VFKVNSNVYFFFKKFVIVMDIFTFVPVGKNNAGNMRDVFEVYLVKFLVRFCSIWYILALLKYLLLIEIFVTLHIIL